MSDAPDELHYAAGVSAKTRKFHADADCGRLNQATRVTSCPTTHPPRGQACDECFPDRYIDQIIADAQTEPAHAD